MIGRVLGFLLTWLVGWLACMLIVDALDRAKEEREFPERAAARRLMRELEADCAKREGRA